MKIKRIAAIILSFSLFTIFGCGGGGGSAPGPASTIVSGTAAKGPVSGGTVTVYAVRNGAVDPTPLGTPFTPTPANGSYTVNIGSYTGPVLIEITGGTYVDEATGAISDIQAVPLRAFVAHASGNVSAAVTALTEIAAKRIVDSGAPITESLISTTNSDVGSTFGVGDIIGTQPVDAAATGAAGAPAAQQEYGMALAALSKYMQLNARTLGQSVADFSAPATADLLLKLNSARTDFINDTNRNRTAITGNKTATKAILKLRTVGTLTAPSRIGGIEVVMNLPPGVSIPLADAGTGEVSAAALAVSGVAVATGTSVSGRFTAATDTAPATIKLIMTNVTGFLTGEFVTVTCDVTAGSVVTAPHFIPSGFKAVDSVLIGGSLGGVIPGITPALTATFQ